MTTITKMESTETPHFEHDCRACKFLGHYNGNDLYFCGNNLGGDTVIARYGSEGPYYKSGLEFAHPGHILYEAKRRAITAGFMAETKRKVNRKDLGQLKWAWSHKEDITKYVHFADIEDDLRENYPLIIEAWETFSKAHDNMTNTVNNVY